MPVVKVPAAKVTVMADAVVAPPVSMPNVMAPPYPKAGGGMLITERSLIRTPGHAEAHVIVLVKDSPEEYFWAK